MAMYACDGKRIKMLGFGRFALAIGINVVLSTTPLARADQGASISEPTPVAKPMTLEAALRRALESNPAYLAAAQGEDIARGAVRDARLFSNPEVELEAPGLFRKRTFANYQLTIAQDFEVAGQRGLRIGLTERALARAQAEAMDAARVLLGEVSMAFVEAVAAERRHAVIEENREVLSQLLEAVRRQRAQGAVSDLEANLATTEFGRADARLLRAESEIIASRIALARSIGIEENASIRPTGAGPNAPEAVDLDQLTGDALTYRPDLAARHLAVAESSDALKLARRTAYPDLRIGLLVEGPGSDAPTDVGAVVGLALPLWNRNQGIRATREAELVRSRLEVTSLEIDIRAEVRRGVQVFRTAHAAVVALERDTVKPARDNLHLIEVAYEAGKIDLPSALLLRSQMLDTELEYLDARVDEQRAIVELDLATAATLRQMVTP